MVDGRATFGVGNRRSLPRRRGAIWGIDWAGISANTPGAGIDVTFPTRRSPAPFITAHHSSTIGDDPSVRRGGLLVTSLARTVVDLGELRSVSALTNVLHEASIIDDRIAELVEIELATRPSLRQTPIVRDALSCFRAGDHGTINEFEEMFAELVAEAGVAMPSFGCRVPTETISPRVDAGWLADGLVIELDGQAVHRTLRKRKRDAQVTAALELAGFEVWRLRWRDLREGRAQTKRRLQRRVGGAANIHQTTRV